MKPHPVRNILNKLIIANVSLLLILMLLGTSIAKQPGPPFPFPGGKRGQEAITALQDRLPEVASRHGKSAEKLKEIFLHDNDLWLDPAENLLYLCSFGVSEAEALPESAESAIPTGPFPLDQTFQLHSLDGASKIIYLDFDGHVTTGTSWNSRFNSGNDIVSVPYNFEGSTSTFSNAELSRIQNIWAKVAEDFAIYNIDVTTEDPGIETLRRSPSGDEYYGMRVVISPSSSWYGSVGGVAYVGSFDWDSDTPTFVFSDNLGNGDEKYVTDVASHETGHTLGLYHDGKTDGTEYYLGHGSWAPIMGAGFYQPITQWSKGEYAGANQTQDDLAVMLNNGASYRTDDYGDWIDSATMLNGDILNSSGIIERTGDVDVFSFQTGAGNITINVDPADLDPNLDILVQILDDDGNLINQDDPYYILPASLNLNLPAGTYYILIDGVGTGDPDTGYTDYASLGQYFISGMLQEIDSDEDEDDIPNDSDNCPVIYNPGQQDFDADGLGDACDSCIIDATNACENYEVIHRINAGGPDHTDSLGNNWSADYGFNTGESSIVSDPISGTSEPVLYQSERYGPAAAPELVYDLAVSPGSYLVRLYFADIYSGTNQPGARIFDVAIEGQTVLNDFDIVAQVGPLSAIIKEFVIDVTDNSLEIEFTPGVQSPKISAIEVLHNIDIDNDGVADRIDNCPNTSNPDQADLDGDGLGDSCDSCANDPNNDIDNDGICGDVDNCPTIYNSDQTNTDGDNYGNACDGCPEDPNKITPGTTGCGNPELPPIAQNDRFVIPRNIPGTFNILANDTDPDGTIDVTTVTLRSTTSVRGNVLTVNPDGTVTYTPDGSGGPDYFYYTVADDNGAISNEARVRVNRVRAEVNP